MPNLEEYRERKNYIETMWGSAIRYLGGPGWEIQAEEYRQKMVDELEELKKEFGPEIVLLDKLVGYK